MAFPWLKTGDSPPNKGKKTSEAIRLKISMAKKKLADSGWKPGNFGKTMNYSDEHMAKLRENLKLAVCAIRKRTIGEVVSWESSPYKYVYQPDHPSANSQGYVHEHRSIAERVIGRKLKKSEVVHHINGNKSDNRNSNLLICERSLHHTIHHRMSYLFQQAMFGEV